MGNQARRAMRGQAIVLVALLLTVLFGFVGLAIDGGRAYLERRQLQAGADAAALGAAYGYMNSPVHDISLAELAARDVFAKNLRLYTSPDCVAAGSACSFSFGDPMNNVLVVTPTDHSIAGVTFTATATHRAAVTMMQVLGFDTSITVGATATALARQTGTNGAAIQTLSPGGCAGGGGNSLTFQGNSTTLVTGDIWSNGNVFDNSAQAGGSVAGNIVAVCGATPFLNTPTPWTVSGSQVDGWNMPDPGYASPPINPTARTWNSTNGSTELPGTYAVDPHLPSSAGCYFLAGGVYEFSGGFTDNGGFVSNKLRPPDEPFIVATTAALSGTISSIPVSALAVAVPANSTVTVATQPFTVTSAGAASGATSIPVQSAAVSGTIPAGAAVVTMARSNNQFWDANRVNCSGSFSLSSPGSGGGLTAGAYSVEVTAVRWQSTTTSACTGPASPTCYERESAPSMCKVVAVNSSGNLKVQVTGDPGAADFNVYVAANGNCTGLTFCTNTGSQFQVTIPNCPSGQPGPPDSELPPLASTIPNSDPAPGVPPRGDLADEGHCVDPATGANVACPTGWTPGAVSIVIPGASSNSPCLNLEGQGDIYIFSGYQYGRIVLFEPGPEQSSLPNNCAGNNVNGNGFTSLIGIFYMPAASVTINGNSNYHATIAGGVIAWTASIIGRGQVAITADPTLRAWPSTVRLTQ